MKLIKMLTAVACAAAFLISTSAVQAESCCVKAKAAGKECQHACCVKAHKAGKCCATCQAKPSCCDKAIAKGKTCKHKCCVAAAKAGKVCTKCNPPKKANKKS